MTEYITTRKVLPKTSLYGCNDCPITICLSCFYGSPTQPAHAKVCEKTGNEGRIPADKCEVCGYE